MAQLLESLINQLNLKVDFNKFLEFMQLQKNYSQNGAEYLMDCPFKCGANSGGFSINSKTRICKCSNSGCKGGENLKIIDMYAKANGLSKDDAAIKIFENVGVENPEDNQTLVRNLYLNIAEKYELEGLNEAAKNMLLKAYQDFPKNLIILSRLANIHTKDNCNDKACKYLLQAVDIVLKMRNYSSAHSTLKRILTLDPENKKASEIYNQVILAEWRDFIEDKFTKEEKDNFSARISFKEVFRSTQADILIYAAEKNREDLISEIFKTIEQETNKDSISNLVLEIERKIESKKDIVSLYYYMGIKFAENCQYEKAYNFLVQAKDAAKAGKISVPPDTVSVKLEEIEEKFFKDDFEKARNFIKEGYYAKAADILFKIISSGIKKHEIFEQYIICEYKQGREKNAAEMCIQLSDYFYRKDNHIGALIALYRGLNFVPDFPPIIEKLCKLYADLEQPELLEEIKVESDKRKKRPVSEIILPSPEKLAALAASSVSADEEMDELDGFTNSRSVSVNHEISKKIPVPAKKTISIADLDDDLDLSFAREASAKVPRKDIIQEASVIDPNVNIVDEEEIPIELPAGFRLSGNELTTDLSCVVECVTVSVGTYSCKLNLGSQSILGLPTASINYTLNNAQIVMTLDIPGNDSPKRLYGQVVKVQSSRVSDKIERIVTIQFVTDSYPDRKCYIDFLEKYKKGEIDLASGNKDSIKLRMKSKEYKEEKKLSSFSSVSAAASTPIPRSSDTNMNVREISKSSSPGTSKINHRGVYITIVGYRDSNQKPLNPLLARTLSLKNNILEIDYGMIDIPGVQQASINYFLKTNKNVMIEFSDPKTSKKIKVAGETVGTKTRREGRAMMFSADIQLKQVNEPETQALIKYLV